MSPRALRHNLVPPMSPAAPWSLTVESLFSPKLTIELQRRYRGTLGPVLIGTLVATRNNPYDYVYISPSIEPLTYIYTE